MAYQQGNFDFKGQVPMASIIQAYQNKAAQEMQGKQMEQQAKQQRLNETLGIIKSASGLVQQGVQLSANRMNKNNKNAFAELLAKQETELGHAPPNMLESTLNSQKSQQQAAFMKAYPTIGAKEQAKSLFGSPTSSGKPALQKAMNNESGKLEYVHVKPDGSHAFTGLEAPGFTPEQQQQQLDAATQKSQSYTDRWIQPASERMMKSLDENRWNTNDPAGISAKRALFARSGMNLIEQTRNQPGGADARQTVEVSMDVMRVLIGNGVVSEKLIHSMVPKTARGNMQQVKEWLTNEPTGLKQQEFIERFHETLSRQEKLHSNLEEKIKRKSVAGYTRLKKQAPEEFDRILDETGGYDPAEYRRTGKLRRVRDPIILSPEELMLYNPEAVKARVRADADQLSDAELEAEIRRLKGRGK